MDDANATTGCATLDDRGRGRRRRSTTTDGRSVGRSVTHAVGRSHCRSVGHTCGRSVVFRSPGRSVTARDRSVTLSPSSASDSIIRVDRSIDRAIDRSIVLSRSFTRSSLSLERVLINVYSHSSASDSFASIDRSVVWSVVRSVGHSPPPSSCTRTSTSTHRD